VNGGVPSGAFAKSADRKIRVEIPQRICYTWLMMKNDFTQQANDFQRVEAAIHYLEANFRQRPNLDEMARSVHLSKYHFQRLFKRWAGISPTQFLHFLTVEYAKEKLQASQSVLDTALDAGLSGPGRLHDLFVTFEAITPGEFKRQGAGLQIAFGFHETPFGQSLLATTERGICALYFVPGGDRSATLEQLTHHWPQARLVEDPSQTQPLVDRIFAPVSADQPRPFHLLLKGTNFQVKVWQALLAIPSGALVSYQDVAAYLDRPDGACAVGGAIARNPVAYLIPCHRVINKTGQIHHYRWGATRKKAMVGWEASQQAQK
jgi:AraC family transcriptional regulator of adaptative response/methylated-DNA-[protein]-cysteine methyltransferase